MGLAPKLPAAIQPPEIVARELAYPRRDIWILLAVCAVVRLALVPVNVGEYTDGVIQAKLFADPQGIWPPLYAALIYPLKFVLGYLWSGRLISVAASTLALWPLYRMTQRAFGTRAALYAGIFYITAPVANRWGVRLMTDATFSLFFWWTCERLCFASDERNEPAARRAFGWACLGTVLAALTRYQGMMLLGPVVACWAILSRRFGRPVVRPALTLLGLALVPGWVMLTNESFIHLAQFTDRALAAPKGLSYVMAVNGEAFLAYFPYFLTYPVFACALAGMFWTRQRRGAFFGWTMLYSAVVLLIFQSAFSSFQERYFLPVMGFFWVLAGSGMYAFQERWLRPHRSVLRRAFPYLLVGVYLWSSVFALAVAFGQREAWADIVRASRHAAKIAEPGARLFTNDVYSTSGGDLGARKVEFFSGRSATFLNETYMPNPPFRLSSSGERIPRPPAKRLAVGDLIILSDVYNAAVYEDYLRSFYRLEEVHEPFQASLLPLLPDNMSIEYPMTGQNPLAWVFRYDWQHFVTRVYRVEALR
ncbi:MAG: glycosyltransferase family 39 protein [Candidatus Sumerlaeia bacterium]|nr:glycosyltransferase family 39 protein [Candidatus Sumerlaeia bacterium]